MVAVLGELLEGEGSLVIRHVDRLSPLRLQALWIALEHWLRAGSTFCGLRSRSARARSAATRPGC